MILAGRIREALGLPGMTVAETMPFRDKEQMKLMLDSAGIRTPDHARCSSLAEVWHAAEQIGYPLIVKPITGAGSADTYRVDSTEELSTVLSLIRHVSEVSVEEFVEAEEFTYDTVCAKGEILFENICWYRPRPLQARSHEWISPMTVALRDLDDPGLADGRQMGRQTLAALGFQSGFTHMEWYRKADGEVVFGEIGARPPGGRTVDVMNFATDGDLFLAWAEAVVHGKCLPSPGAQVQRREHLQARGGFRLHRTHRRVGPPADRARRRDRGARAAPRRGASSRLAGHVDLGRDDHRPPPRSRRADPDR